MHCLARPPLPCCKHIMLLLITPFFLYHKSHSRLYFHGPNHKLQTPCDFSTSRARQTDLDRLSREVDPVLRYSCRTDGATPRPLSKTYRMEHTKRRQKATRSQGAVLNKQYRTGCSTPESTHGFYCAGGCEELSVESNLRFCDQGTTVVMKGIFVDSVSVLGQAVPSRVGRRENATTLASIIEDWKSLLGITSMTSFWRTILMDVGEYHLVGTHFIPRVDCQHVSDDTCYIPPRNAEEEEALVGTIEDDGGGIYTRRFMGTAGGRLGLAAKTVEVGDRICVLLGCRMPYILRPLDEDYWRLIGEWYDFH